MARANVWHRLRSWWKRDDAPPFLNDTSAFDFSDEVGDEDFPRFNKLRVVVADDGLEPPDGLSGPRLAFPPDDDSLLDQDGPLPGGQLGFRADPCDSCRRQRELLRLRKVKTRLTLAGVLYLLFMIGELVGGYIANSLAIMTDALHMLTDLSAIILTLFALWLSAKSPTKRFTFGFHRLGAILNISSASGMYPIPLLTVYSATKAFVDFFSQCLHAEYRNKGIFVQSVLPFFVATKLAKIRKPTFDKPSSETFVKCAMKTVGRQSRTNGYPVHAFMGWVFLLMPLWLSMKISMSVNKGLRAHYLKKAKKS